MMSLSTPHWEWLQQTLAPVGAQVTVDEECASWAVGVADLRDVCLANIAGVQCAAEAHREASEGGVPDNEDTDSLDFYRLVGDRVRSARIAAGLSQALLAERVGLTRSSVANLEAARQRTSLYHFVLISRALKVDVGQLLPDEQGPQGSRFTSNLQNELADSPETAQEFVRGAVARLQGSGSPETETKE
jgi:transcriptional regulator with XRE-family HTH domain